MYIEHDNEKVIINQTNLATLFCLYHFIETVQFLESQWRKHHSRKWMWCNSTEIVFSQEHQSLSRPFDILAARSCALWAPQMKTIRMSHWRRRTTEGAEFWITFLAFLSSFSCLQVIQNKRPWCSAAAYVPAGWAYYWPLYATSLYPRHPYHTVVCC